MSTKVLKLESSRDYGDAIREAAGCLASGGLVVFPTETVYGLGADATNPAALKRLRAVKQRDDGKPFTAHIGSRSVVDRFVPEISGLARRLIEKAWPGPLTVIFQVNDVAAAAVVQQSSLEHAQALYHEGTIGIRCPDDRNALSLLNQAGVPVVASSANPAHAPPPVDAEAALATLDGQVDLVLDAGRTRYARPSTIVQVNGNNVRVLREGVIDERTVRRLTQVNFLVICSGNTCRSPMAEGLLRRLLAERLGCSESELAARGYYVESAGVSAYPGMGPTPAGVQALKKRGIDISNHRSRPLTLDQVNRADYIFTMTDKHLDAVLRLNPQAAERTRRIADGNIEDPIGESGDVYDQCAAQLEEALRSRLQEITL